jgi:hypothetical protein
MHQHLADTYEGADLTDEVKRARQLNDSSRVSFLKHLLRVADQVRQTTGATSDEIAAAMIWMLADGRVELTEVPKFYRRFAPLLATLNFRLVNIGADAVTAAALYGSESTGAATATQDRATKQSAEHVLQNGANGYPLAETVAKQITKAGSDLSARSRRAALLGEAHTLLKRDIRSITSQALSDATISAINHEANGAYNRAIRLATTGNSRVTGYRWVLSAAHTKRLGCVCEDMAGRTFSKNAPELEMFPPHNFCMCSLAPVVE